MSPKDIRAPSPLMQFLADMVAQMPDEDDLTARVSFGASRAATLLEELSHELQAAGDIQSADSYHRIAEEVAKLCDQARMGRDDPGGPAR